MPPRLFIVILAALLAPGLVACDPPPRKREGAAVVALPEKPAAPPAQVEATLDQLRATAPGGYRDLAKLANMQPVFRSNSVGLTHVEFWRLKTSAGEDPVVQLHRILAFRPEVRQRGAETVYVWPWFAEASPDRITPSVAHDIDALIGAGQADRLKQGGAWPGYSLGVAEDGTWLWFTSGGE